MRRSKASEKPEGIDFSSYQEHSGESKDTGKLEDISEEDRQNMLSAGVDVSEKNRSGTFIQSDHKVVHAGSLYPGLEVMDINRAFKKYDWLEGMSWNLVPADKDKFTEKVYNTPHNGYFLRAKEGQKAEYPLQSCLFLKSDNINQNVHNIIIAEENSQLQIITGCARSGSVQKGLHIGVSEIYVKKGAKLTFTMIHNWAEELVVRPRTVTHVEEGGTFLSNYICIQPVRDIQMYPAAILEGKNSVARYNSILFAHSGSYLDVGAKVLLKAPGSRAEVLSRAVSAGGDIVARGYLKGEVPGIKAHLECKGLMITEKGMIHAVPELEGNVQDVDMSHEAAVGKIAKEEIEYLMARGLTKHQAQAAIVRGFLDTSIMGLPRQLQEEIDKTITSCEKEVF